MKKNFKIFAGSANYLLAKKVAQNLGVALGKAEVVHFADGECRVRVEEELGSGTIFVFQPLCPPVDENLMELSLFGNTLKRNGARKLVAIVPYLSYARQDKVHRKGECLSAEVVAKIIEASDFEKLITFDVHSEKALSFFKIPTENLSTLPVLAETVSSIFRAGKEKADALEDCAVVAPDKGATGRVQRLAKALGVKVVVIEKDRDLLTGRLKIKGVKGEVAGKRVVICDDMITSGGTLVLAAEFLKHQKVSEIFACAVHPLLVKSAPQDLQKSAIKKIITTDIIPVPKEKRFKKLEVVTVASLIASAIENNL